ncbi:MAG: ribosome-binding factor A [Patescibacteria group bacterium]
MSERIQKINDLVRAHLNEIILKEVSLKSGVFATIAKVDTTSDLRYTRVFVSIFPEKEIDYVIKTFEKEIYRIQGALNKKLSMRPLPKIEFKVDLTESKAEEIEKLLKEI